jgi:hypothetical protein
MALRKISQEEFEAYNLHKLPTLIGIATEVHWFANDGANIIGTVLFDNIDKDWSIVMLALEDDGEYRFADGNVSIVTEEQAVKIAS